MDSPQKILNQLTALWQSWSLRQRATTAAGVLLCVAAVVGVGIWASQPEYVTLADHLTPGEAAEVVSALEANAIIYQLNFAGSAVLVPHSDLNRARLCTKDVVVAAPEEASEWGDSLWSDPTLNQARLLREQELRMARSIKQMRAVRDATVHISKSQSSPFIRERVPTKASVVLELHPGQSFTGSDAQGLVALLAHGIEGLDPKDVSIVDTAGRQLAAASGVDADIHGRLEYQQRLEAIAASKAEAVLSQVLGAGNATVRVTTEVDFTQSTRTEKSYDPEVSVKVSEDKRSTIGLKSESTAAAGPPGTASNLASVSGKSSTSSPGTKEETSVIQYLNGETVDTQTLFPGRTTRLTVAAVVHPPVGEDGKAAPAIDTASLESLIKQAVGFDETRNDQVTVIVAPPGAVPAALPTEVEAPAWQPYERLIRLASLGIGAIAALALGFMVLRRLRPVAVAAPPAENVSLDVAHRLAELSQVVRQQPDLAAKVVASWLAEETKPPVEKRRAA
jgi:flagellar M-ring protein FliF